MTISKINNKPINSSYNKKTPLKKEKNKKLPKSIYNESFTPSPKEKKSILKGTIDGIKNFIKNDIIGTGKDFTNHIKENPGTQAKIAGTLIGGTAGGVVGYQAGKLEESNTKTSSQQWLEPDMKSKNLGNIPGNYYRSAWGWGCGRSDNNQFYYDENGKLTGSGSGIESVYRDAPVYNEDGSIKMHTEQQELNSGRFGPVGGAVTGALLGSAGGFLGGCAISLINKLSKEKF